MSAAQPRRDVKPARLAPRRVLLALTWACVTCVACVDASSYGARGRYQGPEPPAPAKPEPVLLSAHLSAYGDEPTPLAEAREPRMLEREELAEDRILLVFGQELDPLTVDARGFGVIRADGRRVRPRRAFLAPADEGDENRSLTLLGNFGSEGAPPVAVHVIAGLYAETGEELRGLDAQIRPLAEPDLPLLVERVAPSSSRCPEAQQVIRSYWTDTLSAVGEGDLQQVELRLADGRTLAPVDFDDQARREGEAEDGLGPGRGDDNVLDLCVDATEAVVHVRFAAGIFSDAGGRPTAAADLTLSAAPAGALATATPSPS